MLLRGRPPLPYDVLSLNMGITPALSIVPGAAQHTTPVKPIGGWVRWQAGRWGWALRRQRPASRVASRGSRHVFLTIHSFTTPRRQAGAPV